VGVAEADQGGQRPDDRPGQAGLDLGRGVEVPVDVPADARAGQQVQV
jgi:hypothetical protein